MMGKEGRLRKAVALEGFNRAAYGPDGGRCPARRTPGCAAGRAACGRRDDGVIGRGGCLRAPNRPERRERRDGS